jgi:enoyl-CoA hydratase/carnithine racemase
MRLEITRPSAHYWRVTLNNPPINLFDPEMLNELCALIGDLERDEKVRVVVFDSALPDFFMAHLDVARAAEFSREPGPTGLPPWPDVALRLERAPFVSVGLVRGRARGVGSEFLLALDVRFASRERAILGQLEVGTGLFPGGGGLERLPKLIGRARAIEVVTSADDFDADTAERYGWVNRSIPDAELDAFVERFAARLAGFDRRAIATAKQIINERTGLPQPADLAATEAKFLEALTFPEVQARLRQLFEEGFQRDSDLERRMGHYLGIQQDKAHLSISDAQSTTP